MWVCYRLDWDAAFVSYYEALFDGRSDGCLRSFGLRWDRLLRAGLWIFNILIGFTKQIFVFKNGARD